jgi:hypothetical protein
MAVREGIGSVKPHPIKIGISQPELTVIKRAAIEIDEFRRRKYGDSTWKQGLIGRAVRQAHPDLTRSQCAAFNGMVAEYAVSIWAGNHEIVITP